MLKKVNFIMNLAIFAVVGAFAGYVVYVFCDRMARPDFYAVQSAPWYTGILVNGLIAAAALTAAVIVKLIIRRVARMK